MEGHAGSLATGAGTSAALAFTGLNTVAYIVAALTLLFAGLALLKIVPLIGRTHRRPTISDTCDTAAEADLASQLPATATAR
jgi:hypothetical protein